MVLEADRAAEGQGINTGLPRVQTSPDLPRWLVVVGLVAGLTLFAALLRYAIDLLGVVFLIIVVGFSIRAISDWLTEGESVSGWVLAAVSGGLVGTLTVALWLFGSHDRSVSALERRIPGPVMTAVEWLEDHGWGQRVLLSGDGIASPAPVSRTAGVMPAPAASTGSTPGPVARAVPEPPLPHLPERTPSRERRTKAAPQPGEAEAATLTPEQRNGRTAPGGVAAGAVPAGPAEAAPISASVPTSLSLSSSQATAVVGTAVRLTVTVTANGSTAPQGSVIFFRGTVPLGTASVRGGANGTAVATYSTLSLPIGTHEIVAEFHGVNGFADARSAPIEQVVKRH
jgi:hypothetical protein